MRTDYFRTPGNAKMFDTKAYGGTWMKVGLVGIGHVGTPDRGRLGAYRA